MINWSAHLMPEKNTIKLYRRTTDLTQIKHDSPDNRKTIAHAFSLLTRTELFEKAEEVLENAGYTINSAWSRDTNFDIWYIRVSEPIPEII